MKITGNIAILGFGREGISTYHYLKNQGIQHITILDKRSIDEFTEIERNILSQESHILGDTYLDTLGEYDIIIKAPGISPYEERILPHKKRLSSQAQIFFDVFKGRIIAVTGTKGKSTTTSLIYTMLHDAGYHTGIVGNIGNPVLDSLGMDYEYVIFEMSSYMLDGITIDPYISVIVNLYQEHLDYHRGWENYKKAKFSIIGPSSYIIYPKTLEKEVNKYKNHKTSFGNGGDCYVDNSIFYMEGEALFPTKKIKLLGKHNEDNISSAILVGCSLQIDISSIQKTMENFVGLPHRLEKITTKNDITFYDDAISTTPESTIAALRSIPGVDTIFLGGSDRGYDFDSLIQELRDSEVRNIVFFPDTGYKIEKMLDEKINDLPKRYTTLKTRSMQEAVDFAFIHTKGGKSCLLSCASPSYSLWKNFEVKGDEFRNCILHWKGE